MAQDLSSYGRDIGIDDGINKLIVEVANKVDWVRLLYLYPSSLNDRLIESIIGTGIPYFDLSLQHVSAPLVKRMRRYGSYEIFSKKIEKIRKLEPNAVMRSSFLIGYPGETEADHDELLRFIEEMQLDWIGFFTFSPEDGTYALSLENAVPESLAKERLEEASLLQDSITARKREEIVGSTIEVLLDSSLAGRSFREAPEIDGVVMIDGVSDFGIASEMTTDTRTDMPNAEGLVNDLVGEFLQVEVVSSIGPDLEAKVVSLRDEY
ncbi:MAG: radical SAM protein [Acidimicrobiales bacterium]|nr:radical SAM protein [Acidimicrobiales bacterium]